MQLGKCDDTAGNPRANCINALQADIVDMVNIADSHSSALRVNGKLALLFYTDSALMTSTEWPSCVSSRERART